MRTIELEHVGIRYMVGDFKGIGLKEYLVRRLTGKLHVQEFWADRDISIRLRRGDTLGIIGTNGAGKSTLLKAISGVLRPTEGTVRVHGRIASLLELASGFDADMTVRENTYLRGAILGYTRRFMDKRYSKIIAFAELEKFQDTPFRHLSSGMKSRLAFAIASMGKPNVLILDEVLSVGDGAFKAKSARKMRQMMSGGVTTILVSHSIGQIRKMCNKVLWLHKGRQIMFSANVDGVCRKFQKFLSGKIPLPEPRPAANSVVADVEQAPDDAGQAPVDAERPLPTT